MSKKIAFIFPGQGSQSIGMGKSFYENSAIAKEMIENASKASGIDFNNLLFNENELLDKTEYTQPAIFLVSMVAYRLFNEQCGIKPHLLLGHSLGEISALCASGAIDYIDGVKLTHNRGKYMAAACEGADAGMMVVLGLDDKSVENICSDVQSEGKSVWAANYNQEGQIVVAGKKGDLSSMESVFKSAGAKRAMLLNMSIASHCPMLSSAIEPLRNELKSVIKDSFIAPIISNVTTKPYSSSSEAIELLGTQLVEPVRYKQSIEAIKADVDLFIEFGNGSVLKGLNKKIAPDIETLNINDYDSLLAVCERLKEI